MAYPNFQFPGVELTQEFVETPVTGVSALGVALIGQKYVVENEYTDSPDITGVTYSITGTTISKPLAQLPIQIAETLENATVDETAGQGLIVVDGVFAEFTDTAVVLSAGSEVTHTFETTSASTSFIGKEATVIKSGTATQCTVTAVEGTTVTLTFDTAITGGTYEVDIWGLTPRTTKVDTYANAGTSTSSTFLSSNGTLTIPTSLADSNKLKLRNGTYAFKVCFRAAVNTTKYALGTVGSRSDIVEQLGYPCAANPLALDALFALNAANGNVVYYVTTLTSVSGLADKYSGALDFLAKNPEVYSIVPDLVGDSADTAATAAITQMLAQVVNDSSDKESKIRRTLWFGVKNPTSATRDQLVSSITANALGIHNYRAQAVWADDALYNGEVIPNSALAAAAAGMRAGQPVHRPISNLGYDTFSINEKYGLTKTELEALGANGIWIIGPNFYGTPINMRQVTTDNSGSLMKFEESIISNVDSIALSLCHLGESMVGCSNISPALITALTDAITTVMTSMTKNMTGSDLIGPQLIGWSLDEIYQDTVFRDRVYATITCEPPRPFNRFVMTLRVV